MIRRSDEDTETPSWFANTKNYSLLHLLADVEKRETEWAQRIERFWFTEEINRHEKRERSDTDLNIILFSVVCLAPACALVPSSWLPNGCETLSWSSSKMGAVIFGSLYIIASYPQLNTLFCLLSHVHSQSSSAWATFSQSESVANLILMLFYFIPGDRCYPNLDLGNL